MQDIYFYYKLTEGFQNSEEEFNGLYEDLGECIDTLAYLVNTIWQEGIKDDSWNYFAETLGIKFITQLSSLRNLSKGTNLVFNTFSKSIYVIDVSSLYILSRSLIENYLIFYYLFIEDVSKEEKRARWILYEISGLKSRRKIHDPKINFEEKRIKLESEKIQIEKLTQELGNNLFYKTLDPEIKKKIKKNNLAKIKDWSAIISESNLSDIFRRSWKLYSNYSHNEYLSLMQIKDYWSKANDTLSVRNHELFNCLTLCSVVIVEYTNLYQEIKNNYEDLDSQKKRIINLLNGVAKSAS